MAAIKKRIYISIVIGIVAVATIVGAIVLSSSNSKNTPAELLSLGEKYLAELDYEQALVQFLRVIEIEPMNERAYLGAAEAYIGLGQTNEAIAILERGLVALPDSATVKAMLERLLVLMESETEDSSQTNENPNDDYVVSWSDSGFEQMIRIGLDKPDGDIWRSELDSIEGIEIWGLSHIWFNNEKPDNRAIYGDTEDAYIADGVGYEGGNNILSLEDVRHFVNLRDLSVNFTGLSDLSALPELTNLSSLTLQGQRLGDVGEIANMTNLYFLNLQYNLLQDISLLTGLSNLKQLYLYNNQITDLTPLGTLTGLQVLSVAQNNVSDLSPLAELTNLVDLSVQVNNISDLSPLAGLTGMVELSISNNPGIQNLSPLTQMSELEVLYVGGTSVSDYSPVAHVPEVYK